RHLRRRGGGAAVRPRRPRREPPARRGSVAGARAPGRRAGSCRRARPGCDASSVRSRVACRTTMRALIKSKPEPGLSLEDVPKPEIGINDVLIRVKQTGICGTDLHIFDWDDWAKETVPVPLVIGHEFVGEVAAFGSNVTDFEVGDLVSGEGHVVCGR